ncbi:hypothetical protein TNCV_2652081 [Trichonephila clavipes]|nr:hypothetical protein TNCV_2652081 [Trichonephila clavipes]
MARTIGASADIASAPKFLKAPGNPSSVDNGCVLTCLIRYLQIDFGGRTSRVVLVTDSWPMYHEFQPCATEYSQCRGPAASVICEIRNIRHNVNINISSEYTVYSGIALEDNENRLSVMFGIYVVKAELIPHELNKIAVLFVDRTKVDEIAA